MHKRWLHKQHGSRGMSLVELLVVMAIMSVVVLAVMSLYIPAHQSTVAQTQVSDVQSNLRLALRVMTQDLMTAGFLVPDHPVVFPDAPGGFTSPTGRGTTNRSDFILRTRVVGNAFARVTSAASAGSYIRLTVSDPEMVANFPVGSRVRLFESVTAGEIKNTTGSAADRAYEVKATGTDTIDITHGGVLVSPSEVPAETVVLRVRDASQPPLQTIRYTLTNGILERVVNGTTQILARNLNTTPLATDPEASWFDYSFTSEGRVIKIDIRLTGVTQALKDDAISGAKTRQVETTVMLRNIY